MRLQTEIIAPGPLLDEKGILLQKGYATRPISYRYNIANRNNLSLTRLHRYRDLYQILVGIGNYNLIEEIHLIYRSCEAQ